MPSALLATAKLDRARLGLSAAARHLNLRADASSKASSTIGRDRAPVTRILEGIL